MQRRERRERERLDEISNISWVVTDQGLDEVTISGRLLSPEETRRILENRRHNFVLSEDSLNTVSFIYLNHNKKPEVVEYNVTDLPNVLSILGAISTYYSRNVRNEMTREDEQTYRENVGELTDIVTIGELFNLPDQAIFMKLKFIYPGIYFVEVA